MFCFCVSDISPPKGRATKDQSNMEMSEWIRNGENDR